MRVRQAPPPCRNRSSTRLVLALIAVLALAASLVPVASRATAQDATADALARINAARAAIGVPPLKRNAALDSAAAGHANYYRLNFGDPSLAGLGLHNQQPGKPGFTGADMAARARAAGYTGSINENIGLSGSVPATVEWSLDTVNHRLTLLDPRYTDVGFGAVNDGAGKAKIEVIDVGAATWRATAEPAWEPWPPPDATGIALRFDGEAPNPFPGATYPLGYPITLKYNGAGTVAFTAARLTQGGQSVAAVAQAGAGFITRNTYMVAATAPLRPGTAYTVAIAGTLDGQPFTRTWSFTTRGAATGAGAAPTATPAPAAPPAPPAPATPTPAPAPTATPAPVPTATPAPLPTATPPPAATTTPTPTPAPAATPAAALPPGVAQLDAAAIAGWRAGDYDIYLGQAARTWTWGPDVLMARQEDYAGVGGSARTVYYFDKSRMEINDPSGDRASPWFITNGLLAREMIAGQLQVGDKVFVLREPAAVTLAGDPAAKNPGAATYASLAGVASLAPGRNAVPQRLGEAAIETIDVAGVVGVDPSLAGTASYGHYDAALGHNIADVFWHWLTAQPVDWVYAAGHPLTEPYWIETKIDGVDRWVLVQAFERRILTFLPINDPAWRVEAGNVGFHYYEWRYGTPPK